MLGWTTWSETCLEQARTVRLLKGASSKLSKPKLVAGYAQWKRDWEAEQVAAAMKEAKAKLRSEKLRSVATGDEAQRLLRECDARLVHVTKERDELLHRITALDGGAAAAALEYQRSMAEEKEKRVEHLAQMAANRMGKRELAAGFGTWLDMYQSKARRRAALLRTRAARMPHRAFGPPGRSGCARARR